ncbi:GNAT family N-acetyltransferase [Pseudalgibacter alginicilyticus]|nr:GNAT family N-acetyltransferase [Pseudalgibacter alginicilyticus]
MIEIKAASSILDYIQIEALANTIWYEHYRPIIGENQVNYMLEKFQSVSAIKEQIDNGFEYFIVIFDKKPVGYMAVKQEPEFLFLSKIYILNNHRGKNLGRKMLCFIEENAKNKNLKNIRLTVNINNTNSIKAYEKWGFQKSGTLVTDIGNGFVMDDFEMIKTLL